MPPTVWEEIVELAKNRKKCSDCKGAGKVQLFTSWEDPCKTCKGRGYVSQGSSSNKDE